MLKYQYRINNSVRLSNGLTKWVNRTVPLISDKVILGMKIVPENWLQLDSAYVNYRKEIEKWTKTHKIALS